MIPYATYKLIHIIGILLVFLSLGGLTLHAANDGTRASNRARKLVAATHGIGLFVVLLGGFGLLARIGVMHGAGFPGWIWVKLVIWVLLGALFALPYRKPGFARPLWVAIPVLGAIAVYMAIYKPL
jgi:uncharacterized membrane protein SirB2